MSERQPAPEPRVGQLDRVKQEYTQAAREILQRSMRGVAKTKLTPESFDMVLCLSTLEHIPDADKAVENMLKLLKDGGLLILTMPYTEDRYTENVYELVDISRSYVCQSFSRKKLNKWIGGKGRIVEQTYYDCWVGDFWRQGKKVDPPRKTGKTQEHDLSCIAIRKGSGKGPRGSKKVH